MRNIFTFFATIIPLCIGTTVKDPHDEWRKVLTEMLRADRVNDAQPSLSINIRREIDEHHLSDSANFRVVLSTMFQEWSRGLLSISEADYAEVDRIYRSLTGLAKLGMNAQELHEIIEASYLYEQGTFRSLLEAILYKVLESVMKNSHKQVQAAIWAMIHAKTILNEEEKVFFINKLREYLDDLVTVHKDALIELFEAWMGGQVEITESHRSQINDLFKTLMFPDWMLDGITEDTYREETESTKLYNEPNWKPLMDSICNEFIRKYCSQESVVNNEITA
jgi:hypothetical protein